MGPKVLQGLSQFAEAADHESLKRCEVSKLPGGTLRRVGPRQVKHRHEAEDAIRMNIGSKETGHNIQSDILYDLIEIGERQVPALVIPDFHKGRGRLHAAEGVRSAIGGFVKTAGDSPSRPSGDHPRSEDVPGEGTYELKPWLYDCEYFSVPWRITVAT